MSPQRLGQHFLTDASWRARILALLRAEPDDVWLEIGAGHGEMTRELAQRVRRVIAIEVDPTLVETLRRLAQQHTNLEVVAGNVLDLPLDSWAGERHIKVYGNLPYYITSPILHRLYAFAKRIAQIAVVIQLEVAARLTARPGRRDYGYLSVVTQFYAQPEIVLRIPPAAFRPRPKVASALVVMLPRDRRVALGITDEARFLKFLQGCFAQKRKTLMNNLRASLPAGRAEALVAAVGLGPRARAEELTLEQFAALFRQLFSTLS